MSVGLLVFGAMWIFGVHFLVTDERSFLSWWEEDHPDDYLKIEDQKSYYLVLEKVLPSWIAKPLFNCVMCMASFHGTLIYLTFAQSQSIAGWVAFCVALCGLNYLITEIVWD